MLENKKKKSTKNKKKEDGNFHSKNVNHDHNSESAIINTASVVAFEGSPELIDYSSTKGADHILHPIYGAVTCKTGNPCKRSCARSCLDAVDRIKLFSAGSQNLRFDRAYGQGCTAV